MTCLSVLCICLRFYHNHSWWSVCFQQHRKEQCLYRGSPVPGVQIVECGRKIDEEKENDVFFPSFSPQMIELTPTIWTLRSTTWTPGTGYKVVYNLFLKSFIGIYWQLHWQKGFNDIYATTNKSWHLRYSRKKRKGNKTNKAERLQWSLMQQNWSMTIQALTPRIYWH